MEVDLHTSFQKYHCFCLKNGDRLIHESIYTRENMVIKSNALRWLEIVSWRVRPEPLIARACASTPGSRRCKFSDLVTLENFAKFIFQSKISLKVDGENL